MRDALNLPMFNPEQESPIMPTVDRRRFVESCTLLAAGAAGGLLAPWAFRPGDQATAQDQPIHDAEEQLKKLKLELPKLDKPGGATLVPAVRVGDMLYV